MKILLIILTLLTTGCVNKENDLEILEQAKNSEPEAYYYVLTSGAKILPTWDGKSYYVIWTPENFDIENGKYLVTLHGHEGYATRDFEVFHESAKELGYALVSLQWWLGTPENPESYYSPAEVYKMLEGILEPVKSGNVALQGFSRGSTYTYGLTAFDRKSGNNFFGITIANSGHAGMDFPINIEINNGEFGENVFEGSRWIFYCGENDSSGQDTCATIEESKNWVESLGGEILLFMRDPNGEHGDMIMNKKNLQTVLELLEKELN